MDRYAVEFMPEITLYKGQLHLIKGWHDEGPATVRNNAVNKLIKMPLIFKQERLRRYVRDASFKLAIDPEQHQPKVQ